MIATSQSNWRKVKLKDVCRQITVGHVGPMATEYVPDGIPFLRSQNVRPFKFDASGLQYISPQFHSKLRKSVLYPGDVVVTRSGANTGQCCVVPYHLHEANCADLVVIRPSEEADPWFIMYLINSAWGRATIAGSVVGAAQHHFNIGIAKEMLVNLPEIGIQRRISSVLKAYDELIENNRRRIEILEEMARRLYREWFVQFRFPGHAHVPLTDSPLGKIPKGWRVMNLGDVAKVNRASISKGYAPERIHYVDIASVSPGRIDRIEEMDFDDAPSRARRIVQHGDTIWSAVRPNRRSFALILNPQPNLIVSTGFAVLTPQGVPFTFLHQAATTDAFVGYLTNHATGAAYPAVNAGDFERADLLIPPKQLLDRFHATVEPMVIGKHNFGSRNVTLQRTRDLLLPRLISGERDVSELPIEVEAPDAIGV